MKIIVTEDSLVRNAYEMKNNEYVLPNVLYNNLKQHKTSLGDNPCFPEEAKYPFDYIIIKDRYTEVIDKFKTLGEEVNGKSLDEIKTLCNRLIHECMEIERKHRDFLNKLCVSVVNEILCVPENTVIIKCNLVDSVKPTKQPRVIPEDDVKNVYSFDDVDDIKNSNYEILKRRVINSIIQGASYKLSLKYQMFVDEINNIEPELIELYKKITILGDYILFNEEAKIDERNLSLGAYVSVSLGTFGKKTIIDSQALIFPYLLKETIRGFFELFASHSLPEDNEKAMYIIRHADFMVAESWDLRFGVKLWDILSQKLQDELIIPYFFMTLCNLPKMEFMRKMKEILSNTKLGASIIDDLIIASKKQITYNKLPSNTTPKNSFKAIISDEVEEDDFTIEELKNLN